MEYTSHHSTDSPHEIPVTVHNQLDYVSLPVLHLSSMAITNPTLASLFQNGINEQYVHQKFDHRSLHMILDMRDKQLMSGIPSNLTRFHDKYKCPICLLTSATKIPRTKVRQPLHL